MSWVKDLLVRLLEFVKDVLLWVLGVVLEYALEHPGQVIIALIMLARMFGTTVRTGQRGVLFSFGRVRRELEPGFHMLIPIVQRVRKTPVRSITLDLAAQRVTTADALVYEVQANLVYRIVAADVSMVQIDNVRRGIEAVVPMIVQEMLRDQTRAGIVARVGLDDEFGNRVEEKLRRWGVTVEQAGFKSIAPTRETLRLTQLQQLVEERSRVLESYQEAGLSPALALTLLGTDRRPVSRATARYRNARRRAALRRQRDLLRAARREAAQQALQVASEKESTEENEESETEPTEEK